MTVMETFLFAFKSMTGSSHRADLVHESGENLTEDQQALVDWMNEKNFKVRVCRCASIALSVSETVERHANAVHRANSESLIVRVENCCTFEARKVLFLIYAVPELM